MRTSPARRQRANEARTGTPGAPGTSIHQPVARRHSPRRHVLNGAIALGAAAALALAAPLAASAHVRVSPNTATAGSYAVLTFRVPTESATASTVKLEVDLPTDTPFSSVSYQPVAGWTTTVTTSKLDKPVKTANATITEAATKVVWTAKKGAEIKPGQFQRFTISAGPVPDTGSVMLPAHQTYSDGSVVDWAQPTPASGAEPEHPAPTLYINDAPPTDSAPNADGSPAPTLTATTAPDPTASADDPVALGLGIGGVALGTIALAVALVGLVRRRQTEGH